MNCKITIISLVLTIAFIYSLLHTHFTSVHRLTRLQDDVDEITKVILGRKPDETLVPQIDNYVRKRTQGLWDELTSVKKKLNSIDENSSGLCGYCRRKPTDLQTIGREEEPNYALESIGASIVHIEDEPLNSAGILYGVFGIEHGSNFPHNMLDPSMKLGNCYGFKGNTTKFIIKLSHKIIIRGITVEHIRKSDSLTGDISNAPKDFVAYGIEDLKNNHPMLLGAFQYNTTKCKRAQSFYFNNDKSYRYCKIKILSNHGNLNNTCVYRIAIHGKLNGV